ncbi:FAD dependent oxidoreductase [Chaetomium fimeti]|uniref:FAD dependent oxidoreductase n=1 Tax=Chaetomium fimeti TaxID=1854472 RepID=A0AAE0HLJ6_9PEZI|nr:FAD dependent oxidoreductase [Chaetomium fimeti]
MAAQLYPYKLVAWLLERLLDKHDVAAFNLQTNTPVTRIQPYGERGSSSWLVHTDRGQVRTRDVLLATNAYTSHLVPNMTGPITPVRAQVCALEPPPEATQLPHSYVWIKGADHQYLIQRGSEDAQSNDGDHEGASKSQPEDSFIVFGGERPAAEGRDEGISCDDEVDPANKSNKSPEPLHTAYEWTGIMRYSSHWDPWVGRVPGGLLEDECTAPTQATGTVVQGGL